MRRRLLLVLSLLFVVVATITVSSKDVHANGRFPASNAVIFDARDPKTIWVRVTFGLLVTHDSGATWHWICERAIGFSGMEDPTYTITPKGTLVGGTFSGIAVSRDNGCTFNFAPGPGGNDADAAPPPSSDPKPLRRARHHGVKARPLSDLAMRSNGDIIGITSTYSKAGPDNTSLFDNHLMISNDDAALFAESGGPIDSTLLLESIEISESDPARIYLSAVRGAEPNRNGVFLVSLNAGMSWTERKIDLVEGETAPFIASVDPKNADRVYVRTHNAVDKPTRLLVTDDAGKTWKKVYEARSPLLGFAMTADGSRVFVGSKEGVATSATDTFNFTHGSSADIQCLGHGGGPVLWACSSEKSGFFIGASKGNGGSFDAKLHLEDLKGVLECPAESSVGEECTAEEWTKQRRALGLPDANEPASKNAGPPGPALKGRQTRTRSGGNRFGAVAGIALVGIAGYYILKRLRRGR
jgi:hypothetical protein